MLHVSALMTIIRCCKQYNAHSFITGLSIAMDPMLLFLSCTLFLHLITILRYISRVLFFIFSTQSVASKSQLEQNEVQNMFTTFARRSLRYTVVSLRHVQSILLGEAWDVPWCLSGMCNPFCYEKLEIYRGFSQASAIYFARRSLRYTVVSLRHVQSILLGEAWDTVVSLRHVQSIMSASCNIASDY
jgi:hypothetical protein